MDLAELQQLEAYLTSDERDELDALLISYQADTPWVPLPGPQTMANESVADVIGYGGAAGGGKTDLACGKAMTQHTRAAIFRREAPQLVGILDRLTELIGSRDGYNSRENIWRHIGPRDVTIEFGSTPNLGDEKKHQGRPKDLLVIDEATNMLEAQARFLMGWVRTTIPGQRCQTLLTFNPPTDSEGRWVVQFFGPWLDDMHPLYPATPGALLWVAAIRGKDNWDRPSDPRPFVMGDLGQRVYDFNPAEYTGERRALIVNPQSRTFIPSRITDNPFLMGTSYMTTLQALPEPLRSQMLNGDFKAGMEDSQWQVCPTGWVDAAMARWRDLSPKPSMDSLGVDVARGGRDNTILQGRHGMWFDKPKTHPGKETPDGPLVAGLAIGATRDAAVIHVDVIGVGSSPFDFLVTANQDVVGVNVSEASAARDQSGAFGFYNLRSELVWKMREALDPANNTGIALPPDQRLRADLCAFTWTPKGNKIYVRSTDEVKEKIGRSPDFASAAVLALIDTPKRRDVRRLMAGSQPQRGEYDPFAVVDGMQNRARAEYDPFANLR
jgi:hypothetical protein